MDRGAGTKELTAWDDLEKTTKELFDKRRKDYDERLIRLDTIAKMMKSSGQTDPNSSAMVTVIGEILQTMFSYLRDEDSLIRTAFDVTINNGKRTGLLIDFMGQLRNRIDQISQPSVEVKAIRDKLEQVEHTLQREQKKRTKYFRAVDELIEKRKSQLQSGKNPAVQ